MYYVIKDTDQLPPSIIHEDHYFAWYNPLKKDHRVEFRGTMNQCYDYLSSHYPESNRPLREHSFRR